MEDRELWAEIVQSGTWLYDGQVLTDVWIVRQNFEYQYEPEYSDREEDLNEDGEAYQVVFGRSGYVMSVGPAGFTLPDAVKLAEELVSTRIDWTNHILQRLHNGSRYLLKPMVDE